MKSELNRELIEGLSESNNQAFLENVNNLVYNLVSAAVDGISQKSPFVVPEKCILIPVNEVCTGAFTQLSTYDFFLGIENAQIEMNTKTQKNFWKFAWREFKASWRLGRKKYKKRKKEESVVIPQTVEKYQLSNFRHDVVNKLSEFLTETSLVYEYGRHFSMIGSEDFGTNVRINVYVGIYDSKAGTFKLYAENRNKFKVISFGSRFDNLDFKVKTCGEMFGQMVKILNAMYSKAYNRIPNQILVESLVFNCPNVLFDKNDLYKTFINVANYIRITAPNNMASICDTEHSIFEEKLIVGAGRQVEYNKIIHMLDAFKY